MGKAGTGDKASVLYEIGDALFYTTSLSSELGGEMLMPQIWPTAAAGAVEPEVAMLVAAARLSGRVKKSRRGDKPLDQFVSSMLEHRNAILSACAEVAANHQSSLQECAAMNITKLKGRLQRNTLKGDGDAR